MKRTPFGIRYESYAAAKAAHGASTVNLFGMEQHTHMLDTMLVRAGGQEASQGADELLGLGSELAAFENDVPCSTVTIGFYGPEAERAKAHNEGTDRLPRRHFFDLNREDIAFGERAVVERMEIRARRRSG